MLRSHLCDFSDAYIVVKETITTEQNTNKINDGHNKPFAFKNCNVFINCISKINGVLIDNAEDLEVMMPMYNLIECSKNYRKATGSLWSYYRDEVDNNGLRISKSFKYKTSITGNTPHNNNTMTDAEIVVPLKHLSNFWRRLSIPLINCELSSALTLSKNCVLTHSTVVSAAQENNPAIMNPKNATFQITDTKMYVPVVTLSKENDQKLLGQLKLGLKRTIKWNKYRSHMTLQPQNNNLNYLIDPTFTKVNRLFVLSFEIFEENNVRKDHIDSFPHY